MRPNLPATPRPSSATRAGGGHCLDTGAPEGSVSKRSAFTLAELLVVIGIIGLLAAMGLPALRGLGESNAIDAATRQMLDDLAYARLRALNDRTTVYMVFVPASVTGTDFNEFATNLAPLRLNSYTLYAKRAVGEQPGRESPRQLIPWRQLPDKIFFATNQLSGQVSASTVPPFDRSLGTRSFDLVYTNRQYTLRQGFAAQPSADRFLFPVLAFNARGQVVRFDESGRQVLGNDEYLSLVRGSVLNELDASGRYLNRAPDVVETPPGNRRYLRLHWLTGRAEVFGDLVVGSDGKATIQNEPL